MTGEITPQTQQTLPKKDDKKQIISNDLRKTFGKLTCSWNGRTKEISLTMWHSNFARQVLAEVC